MKSIREILNIITMMQIGIKTIKELENVSIKII